MDNIRDDSLKRCVKTSSSNNPTDKLKNFNPACDSRVHTKLEMAMRMAGYREISAFARETPFDRSFISKILHLHIKPTLSQAQAITNALNMRVRDIFELNEIRDLK